MVLIGRNPLHVINFVASLSNFVNDRNLLFRGGFITGNVHIDYRCGDPTSGVTPAMAHCAAAVLPAVRSPQRTLSIWQVLAVQVLIGPNPVQPY